MAKVLMYQKTVIMSSWSLLRVMTFSVIPGLVQGTDCYVNQHGITISANNTKTSPRNSM